MVRPLEVEYDTFAPGQDRLEEGAQRLAGVTLLAFDVGDLDALDLIS